MSYYKYDSVGLQDFPYYTGTQISVWFGDIWVDDITSIWWNYTNNKTPLFGYASKYFDAVADGMVIISGSFSINFREKGYITYVVKNLKKIFKDIGAMKSYSDMSVDMSTVKDMISTHLRNGTFGPQTYPEIMNMAKSEDFLERAKLYEDVIWSTDEDLKSDTGYVKTADILQHDMFPEGIDVLISYGDVGMTKEATKEKLLSSTTKTLNGVHLVGSRQVIDSGGGQPIGEAYDFIARSMDDFVEK